MANSKLQGRMPFTYHFILLSLLFFHSFLKAQNLCFEKVNTFNGQLNGAANRSVVDSEGNTYTLGNFQESVSFGTGEVQVMLNSAGGNDTYLSKYDPNGEFVWVKQFGTPNSDIIDLLEINDQDELFVAGSFKGTIDLNPGAGTDEFISGVQKDMFITKLDRNGNYQWSQKVNGDGESHPLDLKILDDGYIIFNLKFNGIQDIDPGSDTVLLDENNGTSVMIMFSDLGNYQWNYQLPALLTKIASDNMGNILSCGKFSGSVDFDSSASQSILTAVSVQEDAFVLKLSNTGDFNWVKQVSGESNKQINDLTCDEDNNILYTGYFSGITDFDPGIALYEINSSNGADAFLTKLSSDGDHLFTKDIGVITPCLGEHIATDNENNIYMSGFFSSTMDFDPNEGEYFMTNSGFGNHFLLKLASNGQFLLAKQIEGDMPLNGNDLNVLNDKRIIISGGYNGTADFDPGNDTYNHTTPSGNGYVVTWYQELETSYSDFICDSYLSPSGNFIWEGPGTYFDTVINEDGCTTIYEITLNSIDTSIQLSSDESSLIASQPGAEYQWIDCDNEVILEGETEQSFTPMINGNFAVEITYNGCTKISECTWFESGNVTTNTIELNDDEFTMYPNPTMGQITIRFKNNQPNAQIRIYSVVGRLVDQVSAFNANQIDFTINNEPGIYIIEINGSHRSRRKIVKL